MTPLKYFEQLILGIDPISGKKLADDHICRTQEFKENTIQLVKTFTKSEIKVQPEVETVQVPADLRKVIERKLKSYRLRVANDLGKPAFVVFNDRTLKDLLVKLPKNVSQLEGVHGFGAKKIELYGAEIIDILEEQVPFFHDTENEAPSVITKAVKPVNPEPTKLPPKLSAVPSLEPSLQAIRELQISLSSEPSNTHIAEMLEDYLDELDGVERLKNKKDALEVMRFFKEVSLSFEGSFIEEHALTQLRRIQEKLPLLRDEESLRKAVVVRHLQKEAPNCKCGSKMYVRDSENGYFFGCSTFPSCFSKRQLTKAQQEFAYT